MRFTLRDYRRGINEHTEWLNDVPTQQYWVCCKRNIGALKSKVESAGHEGEVGVSGCIFAMIRAIRSREREWVFLKVERARLECSKNSAYHR